MLLHHRATIKGIRNLDTINRIEIGIGYIGFIHKADYTYLNIQGKLQIKGIYSIGRGCRFDIGKNAIVTIGNGGYINAYTKLIIMHQLSIGDNCSISWDCQILDENFHEVTYPGMIKSEKKGIIIGNHVLIGSRCTILKGVIIPDGCVIASGSVVNRAFTEKNCLIGGIPANVIKQNIKWK